MIPEVVRKRIEESRDAADGACWEWQGYRMPNGYGSFWDSRTRRTGYAHRASYELFVGPIPEGLQLDHLCRNRACVNPSHLEAVPQRLNLLRGETLAARSAAATHCPQGHPYDEENTYIRPRGFRECRECRRESVRRWRRHH